MPAQQSTSSAVRPSLPIVLADAPGTFAAADILLSAAAGKCRCLLFRWGSGLDPFLLVPRVRDAGIEPGLALHLRDMNRTALSGILCSASACGIHRVMLVDPPPDPDAVPVGPSDGPAFVAWGTKISRQASGPFPGISFGACFRLEHPLDQRLFDRYCAAGLEFAAVPADAFGKAAAPGLELLAWIRPAISTAVQTSDGIPALIDLTVFPDDSSAAGHLASLS